MTCAPAINAGRLRLHRGHAAHQARDQHPARDLLGRRGPGRQTGRQHGGRRRERRDLAGIFQLTGDLDPSTCPAAERDFRKAKAREQTAKEAEFAALERSLGEDLDEDGEVGR